MKYTDKYQAAAVSAGWREVEIDTEATVPGRRVLVHEFMGRVLPQNHWRVACLLSRAIPDFSRPTADS